MIQMSHGKQKLIEQAPAPGPHGVHGKWRQDIACMDGIVLLSRSFRFYRPASLRAWRDCLTMYRKKKTRRESLSIKSRIANLFLGLLGPA